MTVNEKIAYIKGMMEGMELDAEKSKEAKLIAAILDVLEEIGLELEDIDASFDAVDEELNAIGDELDEIEECLDECCCCDDEDCDCCCHDDEDFDDEEWDEDDFIEVDCPACGELLCIDEAVLEEGTIQCPSCEQKFFIDLGDDCCEDDGCCCCGHDHED